MNRSKENRDRDYERLVEEETLIFEATEVISELLDVRRMSRKDLAKKLGRSKGFVTQVLAGDRNMTLRTLADLAFALNQRVELEAVPLDKQQDSDYGSEAVPRRTEARVSASSGILSASLRRGSGHAAGHFPQKQCSPAYRRRSTYLLVGSFEGMMRKSPQPTEKANSVNDSTDLDRVAAG